MEATSSGIAAPVGGSFRFLERDLEDKDRRIKDLRKILVHKDELLATAEERLATAERRRTELESALLALASDRAEAPDSGGHDLESEATEFVASTCRAAKLEHENCELRHRAALTGSLLAEFSMKFNDILQEPEHVAVGSSIVSSLKPDLDQIMLRQASGCRMLATVAGRNLGLGEAQAGQGEVGAGQPNQLPHQDVMMTMTTLTHSESLQLQVKMDLEHERRLRTQGALDEAERKLFQAQRELEAKLDQIQALERKVKEAKAKQERRLKVVTEENHRLERLVRAKESEIASSEKRAKELSARAEEFEDMFNSQLDVVKKLQGDLDAAYSDKRALTKEMEALNIMFKNMEDAFVKQATPGDDGAKVTVLESDSRLQGTQEEDQQQQQQILTDAEGAAGAEEVPYSSKALAESCFKEVHTRTGTRMVLSVSKTFMKLRDLILEKKTLEEQLEKMRTVNHHLCNRVSLHEEKLFNITDELNKTWDYVSKLRFQHQQLHTSEMLLRAELTEKRQLLAKLREELEYSRESWRIVKKKTADSEKEWRALRDEFAARRRLASAAAAGTAGSIPAAAGSEESGSIIPPADSEDANGSSSSESGFSDQGAQTEEEDPPENGDLKGQADEDPLPENDDLQGEADEDPPPENGDLQGQADEDGRPEVATVLSEAATIPVFIPAPSYLGGVPSDLMAPLFPSSSDPGLASSLPPGQPDEEGEALRPRRGGGHYQELYHKLAASTARSAALANQLAEMHRSLARPQSAASGGREEEDDEDDDVDPKTDEESIIGPEEGSTVDLESEEAPSEAEEASGPDDPDVEGAAVNELVQDRDPGSCLLILDEDQDEIPDALEDLGLTPEDIEAAMAASARFGVDRSDTESTTTASASSLASVRTSPQSCCWASGSPCAIAPEVPDDDPVPGPSAGSPGLGAMGESTLPGSGPRPSSSNIALISRVAVQEEHFSNVGSSSQDYDQDTEDGFDGDGSSSSDEDPMEASESATAVTRFLIKHLPKQLAKLRSDKVELEEKVQDLETTISNQAQAMREMERRLQVYKREADTARKWNSSLSLSIGKGNCDGASSSPKDPATPTPKVEDQVQESDGPQEAPRDISTPSQTDEDNHGGARG